jgi:putative transposase
LVTKYRRRLFTDAMLTFCEHTMRAVCAELDVDLVECNGETDHLHPPVAYPPTLAISVLAQRLKGRTAYAIRRQFTGAWSAPACVATTGRRPTSPSPAAAQHCRSPSNTSTDKPDRFERRATPGDTADRLTPD